MNKTGKKILIVFAIILIAAGIYRLAFPSLSNRLLNSSWCVDNIYYKGRRIEPKTLHAVYFFAKGKKSCINKINFVDEGDVQLPGLNSRAIEGGWQIDQEKNLQLSVDTLQDIYQGNYAVDISGDKLVLKSKTTVINSHR
jgi:hypothetical protein